MRKILLIPLLLIINSAYAVEPGSVSGGYLHYVAKGQVEQKPTSPAKPVTDQDLMRIIENQSKAYENLVNQQNKMLDEIKLLRQEQIKQLKNIEEMQMMAFTYQKAKDEIAFIKDQDTFQFFGFKRETLADYYKKHGMTNLVNSFNEKARNFIEEKQNNSGDLKK